MIPKIWELLKRFKEQCKSRGWQTSSNEDLVQAGEKYHSFLWTRSVHPSTFKKLSMYRKCAVQEGLSYRVVNASYLAWVFSQTPPQNLLKTLIENPELSKRTAIYDLSWMYEGKPVCLRVNETDSQVFREFEKFLREKWGVEVKSAQKEMFPQQTEKVRLSS